MSNYIKHAEREFKAAGWTDENGNFKDEMQRMLCDHVMKLLEVFAGEHHSGLTAPYAVNLFLKLAKFEPIAPLTGEDWEWTDVAKVSGKTLYQNKRCSAVFKGDPARFNGNPYFLDAVVFWDWWTDPKTGEKSKSYFTSLDSCREITFPYTPVTVYEECVQD